MDEFRKNEIINTMMAVDYYPSFDETDFNIESAHKLPIASLAALGGAFATMPESIRTLTTTGTSHMDGLYRCTFPAGVSGELAKFKDGSGFLGTIMNEKGFVGQARLNPVGDIAATSSAVIPYDPSMMFMALALMHIEHKLDSIEETQRNILDFLKSDKESKMNGNIMYLNKVMQEYKFYYNDSEFTNLKLSEIENIKRESLQNIDFYTRDIEKFIAKKTNISVNKETMKKIVELEEKFQNLRKAEYLYAYSTFAGVMFHKNFNDDYLDNVAEQLYDTTLEYRELYTKCYDSIDKVTHKSVDSAILGGIAGFNKITGKVINKIPVIEKGPVDEKLIEIGEKIDDFNVSKQDDIMKKFIKFKDPCIVTFINSINRISELYNKPLDICFDDSNIYYIA